MLRNQNTKTRRITAKHHVRNNNKKKTLFDSSLLRKKFRRNFCAFLSCAHPFATMSLCSWYFPFTIGGMSLPANNTFVQNLTTNDTKNKTSPRDQHRSRQLSHFTGDRKTDQQVSGQQKIETTQKEEQSQNL